MNKIQRSRDELFLYPKILMFYRNHRILAVRDILGLQLAPHQRLDLKLQAYGGASDIIRLFSRGMSKTFGIAVDSLIDALLYTKLKVLLLGSGGFRQGKFILEEVERIIKCELDGQEKKNFALKMVDMGNKRNTNTIINKNPDMWTIKFKGGSVIATAPIGTSGDTIRGFRAHKVHVDERKDLKQEIKDRVIRPFNIIDYAVVTQDNQFNNINIDSGTLDYEESDYVQQYYSFLKNIKAGDKRYMVIKFVYPDAFDVADSEEEYRYYSRVFDQKLKFWSVPYGIKVDKIESSLGEDTTDEEGWRAEYLCEPMRATGDYYSYNLIKSASRKLLVDDQWFLNNADNENIDSVNQYLAPKNESDEVCVLGIDCAREDDYTAFSIIRVGPLCEGEWDVVTQTGRTKFSNLIYAYQEKNMHDRDAALFIYELLERFPGIRLVGMDKMGGGSSLRDELYHVVDDGLVDADILYDPSDTKENGIAILVGNRSDNNRLRLLKFGDKDNTNVNRSIRTAMDGGLFYFSGGDRYYKDKELEDIQKYIDLTARQFRFIKTKPTKSYLHFYTENRKKNKKDLYSATIYAWHMVNQLLYEASLPAQEIKIENIAITTRI